MEKRISISEFKRVIARLAADKPEDRPGVWYKTQKEHWLGWLREYNGPGAYGRRAGQNRDARYAYNHVVNYQMLLWLIRAAKVRPELVRAAERAVNPDDSFMRNAGAIRRQVPWDELYKVVWGDHS